MRVEQGVGNIETEIWRDYKALVNETNRMFLARYPFDSMAVSVLPSTADFHQQVKSFDTSSKML